MDATMWWSELGTLDALLEAGTMDGAARVLGVDKATVSRRLAALERDAPQALFERRLRRIELTTFGERALRAFREHQRATARFIAELDPKEADVAGTVRLTVPTFFACELLIPALAEFRDIHPGIDVHVYGTNRLLDVAREEADIAIRNVRPADGSLSGRKLGKLGMAAFASRDYLLRRGMPAEHDLEGHDLLVYDGGPYAGPGFEWWPEAAKGARLRFSANDSLPLRDAARAGLGIAVIPAFLGNEASELSQIPTAGSGAVDIWAVTRAELRRVARFREVLGFLAELVERNRARLAPMN
jgi:DNA-binding transcriptional LysR family regulator